MDEFNSLSALSQDPLEVSLIAPSKEGSIEDTKRAICLQICLILTVGIATQELAQHLWVFTCNERC